MKTDIEIAQAAQLKHIKDIASSCGIDDKYIEQYGNYKAKVDLSLLKENTKEDVDALVSVLKKGIDTLARPN